SASDKGMRILVASCSLGVSASFHSRMCHCHRVRVSEAKRFRRFRNPCINYSQYLKIDLTEDQETELQALIDQLTTQLNGDCTPEECEELDAVLQWALMVWMAYLGQPLSAIVEAVRRPKQTVSRIVKTSERTGLSHSIASRADRRSRNA